jgi:hypothetical protein
MVPSCRHIMPSGLSCQSPAMRGSAFCYFHGRRVPPARKAAASSEACIDVPAVLDNKGITYTLGQVLQGLGNGRISPRRASILLYALQMASAHPSSCGSAPARPPFGKLLNSDAVSLEEVAALAHSLLLDLDPHANKPKG